MSTSENESALVQAVAGPIVESTIDEDLSPDGRLQKEMRAFRTDLLANMIVNTSIRLMGLRDSFWTALLAMMVLAVLIFALTSLLSLVFNRSMPRFPYAALASFLAASSVAIIKLLHDGIFPGRSEAFPENLAAHIETEAGKERIITWFKSLLSIPKQIIVAAVFGALSIPTLLAFSNYANADFRVGSYLLVFICAFGVGHGVYCATVIPTLLKTIVREKMKLYWLNPADTPWIKESSWIFVKLSLADSFIAAFCMFGLYLLGPLGTRATTIVASVWLIVALGTILYTFIYPHYYLNRIITVERNRQIDHLQRLVAPYLENLAKLNEEEFKRFSELTKVYNELRLARSTAIDTRAVKGLVPSIMIPILSFFSKAIVELAKKIPLP